MHVDTAYALAKLEDMKFFLSQSDNNHHNIFQLQMLPRLQSRECRGHNNSAQEIIREWRIPENLLLSAADPTANSKKLGNGHNGVQVLSQKKNPTDFKTEMSQMFMSLQQWDNDGRFSRPAWGTIGMASLGSQVFKRERHCSISLLFLWGHDCVMNCEWITWDNRMLS